VGKTLGSEEGKWLGSGLGSERRKKMSRGFSAYDQNFYINVELSEIG
jgi:hypothetical protein